MAGGGLGEDQGGLHRSRSQQWGGQDWPAGWWDRPDWRAEHTSSPAWREAAARPRGGHCGAARTSPGQTRGSAPPAGHWGCRSQPTRPATKHQVSHCTSHLTRLRLLSPPQYPPAGWRSSSLTWTSWSGQICRGSPGEPRRAEGRRGEMRCRPQSGDWRSVKTRWRRTGCWSTRNYTGV